MPCEGCTADLCKRRGVKLIPRLQTLCATDARYSELLDTQHGVIEEAVLPAGLLQQAANVGKAAVKFAADRMRTTSASVLAERLAICEACTDHFDPVARRCKLCNCFVDVKTKLPLEECPVGKWGPEVRKKKVTVTTAPPCRSCR